MDFEVQIFLRMVKYLFRPASVPASTTQPKERVVLDWMHPQKTNKETRKRGRPKKQLEKRSHGRDQVSWSGLNLREPPTIGRIDTK